MPEEETRIFDTSDENKKMQNLVQSVEETLKDMDMTVKTLELDLTLMEVHGAGPEGKCEVTVYKEGKKAYVRLKHDLPDPEEFWDGFVQFLSLMAAEPEEIGARARVVQKIIDNTKALGYRLPEEDAWNFVYRFLRHYKRDPTDEEINEIVVSYVEMIDQDSPALSEDDVAFLSGEEEEDTVEEWGEEEEEGWGDEGGGEGENYGEITPEDALKEMVREMSNLSSSEKNYYLGLLPTLAFEHQKMLVSKLRTVDGEIDEIPYITQEERENLRPQLMKLQANKRKKKLSKIKKKREKNLDYYKQKEEEAHLAERLDEIETITDLEKEIYLTGLQVMSMDEKEKYIDTLVAVEQLLNDLAKSGYPLNDIERKRHRDELLRLEDEGERRAYLKDLTEEKRMKIVTEELFDEIPQLAFQENEKYVKELMWLEPEERKNRISQLKKDFQEASSKRDTLFRESTAGSTCPKCGWVIGSMSKRCPRCGYNLDDWRI